MMRRKRWSLTTRLLPPVVTMGAIFVLSSRSALPPLPGLTLEQTAIIGHFLAYALLAAAVWWTLSLRRGSSLPRYALSLGIVMVYAVTDEVHQAFVAGRSPELFDLMVDAAGALVALTALGWWASRSPMPPAGPGGPRDTMDVIASRPGSFELGEDSQEILPPRQ